MLMLQNVIYKNIYVYLKIREWVLKRKKKEKGGKAQRKGTGNGYQDIYIYLIHSEKKTLSDGYANDSFQFFLIVSIIFPSFLF